MRDAEESARALPLRWIVLPFALLAGMGLLVPSVARRALSSDDFMPHGHCYMWRPAVLWLHAGSDTLIALAYFSIPLGLAVIVRRRQDLPFYRLFLLLAAFVLACGATHAMEVWTLWTPTYWLSGGLKALTALVSVASAVALLRTLPQVLAMPDRLKELTKVNLQLQTSEARFRYVIEEAPTGMIVFDEEGSVVLVNGALERMFGYTRAEILGQPVEMLLPESARSGDPGHRAAFLREPYPRRVGAGRELSGRRKDGSEIPIELGLTPLLEGSSRRVLGSVVDISDRRRAEEERRDTVLALQSFQLMVERVKDYAIFQLDAGGHIQTWNAGARAIKGYEAEEVLGKHFSIFYPKDSTTVPAEELRIATETGRYEEEGWRLRKDGSRFWANVVITAVPGSLPGSIRGFVKVTRDLTERKRAEDAQANALRERTALLQEVHHRVKNNLQMIVSLLNLQARQVEDEQARTLFLETRGRVRSIALLHESLYQSDDLGRVDMREYIAKLVHALEHALIVGGSSPPVVQQRIEDVLFPVDVAVPCGLLIHELLMNALKHAFTDRIGAPENRIGVRLSEAGDAYTLTVEDNGRGFATMPGTEEARTMGLTLVGDLASQLQGSLTFEVENGARCKVVFPKPRAFLRSVPPPS